MLLLEGGHVEVVVEHEHFYHNNYVVIDDIVEFEGIYG